MSRPHYVTVVIAAYNAEATIHHAIASALAQVGVDIEVIVVDDGSHDGTVATVSRRAAFDARIRMVQLPINQGPAAARNVGLALANGEWVAVLDADDAYFPGRLEHLVELGRQSGADIVSDAFLVFDASTGLTCPALAVSTGSEQLDLPRVLEASRPYRDEADFSLLKPVFKRDFLLSTQLSYMAEARHGEDFLMVVDALMAGGTYQLSRSPYYMYTVQNLERHKSVADFTRQIYQTAQLKLRPGIAGSAELCELIDLRCAALKRQQIEGVKHVRQTGRADSQFGQRSATRRWLPPISRTMH